MKVTVLGSAAAEAVPAMWCECETCRKAWKNGGKDIRRRSSYLIDDDTIVDFGPDSFYQMMSFKIDLTRINRLIFTHSHSDHLNPVDLQWRMNGYSVASRNIRAFGNSHVKRKIKRVTKQTWDAFKIDFHIIHAGEKIVDADMEIYPLKAAHAYDTGEQSLNYVICRNSKYILIANDTGWWDDESWKRIADFKLDAAIIESTSALSPKYIDCSSGHLGANASVAFRDKLRETGSINAKTRIFVNHFSHNGAPLHEDMCRFFEPKGIIVAYDGMTIQL